MLEQQFHIWQPQAGLAVYLCYGYAPKITARVSPQTAHGILRVIAFVLLCIGMQITWNGAEAMLKMVR